MVLPMRLCLSRTNEAKMAEAFFRSSLVSMPMKTNGNWSSRRMRPCSIHGDGRGKATSHLRNTAPNTAMLSYQWSSVRRMSIINSQISTVESDTYWQVSKTMTPDYRLRWLLFKPTRLQEACEMISKRVLRTSCHTVPLPRKGLQEPSEVLRRSRR